jgi:hypothetical protein
MSPFETYSTLSFYEFQEANSIDFFNLSKNRKLACFLINACNSERKYVVHDLLVNKGLKHLIEDIGTIGWRLTIEHNVMNETNETTTYRYFIFKTSPTYDSKEKIQQYFNNNKCSTYAGFMVPNGVQLYFERAKVELGTMWTTSYHKENVFLCGHGLGASCALFLKYDGTFRCKDNTECVVFAPLFYPGFDDVNTDVILGSMDDTYKQFDGIKPCFVNQVQLTSHTFYDYCAFFDSEKDFINTKNSDGRKTSVFQIPITPRNHNK